MVANWLGIKRTPLLGVGNARHLYPVEHAPPADGLPLRDVEGLTVIAIGVAFAGVLIVRRTLSPTTRYSRIWEKVRDKQVRRTASTHGSAVIFGIAPLVFGPKILPEGQTNLKAHWPLPVSDEGRGRETGRTRITVCGRPKRR